MKGKTDEEKAEKLEAHLNAEAFEHYFEHFTDENAPTQEAMSFQKVKAALLEKLSTKKTESETMKEAVNLTYQGGDVKEFFAKESKFFKEARFKEGTKQGMIMKSIQSYQRFLHFALLRTAKTFDEVKETCLEYAKNRKVYYLPKKGTGKVDGTLKNGTSKSFQDVDENALDKIDMRCKKFEDLALLITKSKPKQNLRGVIYHKCKKPGHYASQCQMQGDAVKSCNYCGRYDHSAAACYKKQADEARARNQIQNTQKVQILKKDIVTPVERK